ncbi:hypothetical protein [Streptomyces sp. NPDC048720]|uniref:hypothetical protein n=1 Tax=Streptomyces sp. NPDC048720 TaxID=3365588 RepID=UPI003711EA05
MSNTTPTPGFPPPPPEQPAPAPAQKSRTNAVIIGSAAAVIAAVVATGVIVVKSNGDDSKPAAAAKSSAPAKAAAAEETEPTYTDIDADSFTIELRTTKRQCFGSAGCNLTVEPKLSMMIDSSSDDPDAVYEITYEIHGDESGPVIETAELSDQTNLNYTPSLIQTASSGTTVSVKITDISKQGV